jgi:hypothetical protein
VSTLRAHIFKRRSVGEREEVDIKLFNRDGSPVVLGGGGGGSTSKFVLAGVAALDIPDDSVARRVAFDQSNPSYSDGFGLDNIGNGEVIEIPLEQGVYLMRLNVDVQFVNPAPSGGFVQGQVVAVDADGNDQAFYGYNYHQYSIENPQHTRSGMEMIYIPAPGWHLEFDVTAGSIGEYPGLTGTFELLKA